MTDVERPRRRWSVRFEARFDRLRSSLWFIPGAFAVAAMVAAFALVPVDRLIDRYLGSDLGGILFSGGPDSARLVLSSIGLAMLTLTGLVFSVTILVLQQASSQLSPRVMRTFLRDRVNQITLGLFVAAFLYSLLVLREVRSVGASGPFVPAIAVSGAYLLLVAAVGAFVYYIHHMAQSIRAASVLRGVGDETRAAITRLYPEGIGDEPDAPPPGLPERDPDRLIRLDREPGVVTSVDDGRLLGLARDHGLIVDLVPMVGDFVPQGAPVLRLWMRSGDRLDTEILERQLASTIETGLERTMTQDAAFGFRQIVDIAERALSPGVNDPTTAVQALDELHDLLRRLAIRRLPSPVRLDDDAAVVLRLPRPGWDDYVSLALDEIRQYGAGSLQVSRRLRHLLLDLQGIAPSFRQEPLIRQLRLLEAGVSMAFVLPGDRDAASRPSASGQGPTEHPNRPGPDATVTTAKPPVPVAGQIGDQRP
jgi:uncharacterized membrane protein